MRDIPQNLLELVSDTMHATYPPEPRNKVIAMWLVHSLMNVVENCLVEFCLNVLQMVEESLCLWLADEYGVWTEDHFTYDLNFRYKFTTMVTREGTQIKQHTNLEYEGSRYVRHGFQGLSQYQVERGIVWNENSQKSTESPNC